LQAQILEKMKRDIANIETVISQHAGEPGKPQLAIDQVNYISKDVDEHIKTMASALAWPDSTLINWNKFKLTFKHGEGSWTESKKLIHALNLWFKQLDPS
jgi:hypothetical protein